MAASSDGATAREPLHPSGGGGADRDAPPTARSLYGELATAATDGAMTDSPISGPGATADERLEEALRRAGHGQPPSDPFPTPGFGLSGTPQDPSHGAFSMPSSSPLFPPFTTTTVDTHVGREAYAPSHSRSRRPSEIPSSSGSAGPTASVRQHVLNWENRRRDGARNQDRYKVLSRTIVKSRSPSVRSCRSVSHRGASARPPQQSVQDMAELRESIETFTTHQVGLQRRR